MEKSEYLNIGPSGTFKASGNPSYDSIPQHVDDLLNKMKNDDNHHMVIHFHGGLVSENSGMSTALRMHELYSENTSAQPYSFIWETGLIETFRDNLKTVHRTKLFQMILEMVMKKVGSKLGISVGGKGALTLTKLDFETELSKARPFDDYFVSPNSKAAVLIEISDQNTLERELKADFEVMVDSSTYSDFMDQIELEKEQVNAENVLETDNKDGKKGLVSTIKAVKALVTIGYRVIKRILENRDHGYYPTVIEEIFREFYVADLGSWVWSSMKNKAEEMFKDNAGLDGLNQHAGQYFLQKLNDTSKDFEIKVDLVGHSAGSIVICQLLKSIAAKGFNNIKIRKIILLAPACRCDLFKSEILDHPERYEDFRMFTMNDELESNDMLIPGIYTRSLLYFVSGCLEEKGKGYDEYILGLQRHITAQRPYADENLLKDIHQFMQNKDRRLTYSPSAIDQPEGYRCVAASHGDFDNHTDKNDRPLYTLDSLAWHINN